MILVLRIDYTNHRATTKAIRNRDTFTDWGSAIDALHGWGVLTDALAERYRELEALRHASVHYDPHITVTEREPALRALKLVQEIIEGLFAPLGGPPLYIANTPGAAFFTLDSETIPLVKRVFLPRSALVSPAHRMVPLQSAEGIEWEIVDDADYDPTPLSDEAFAAALPAGAASMNP